MLHPLPPISAEIELLTQVRLFSSKNDQGINSETNFRKLTAENPVTVDRFNCLHINNLVIRHRKPVFLIL